ncbi:MAG: glutamine--fructose-6-phosphate transaminase (isomerizing) [Candidatus Korarchaeota archaeon]|nr:glutamine--fructose-6-phosphate transaminase (isomerizing) [Thermoproteota archaeon]MCR8470242.1 glutamine--fructose-6-phosphate transaminase (isomerizing) [Thermoproteota archaeon]
MCGIAGIVSKNYFNIIPKLIKMLKNLEYRGYDSCGFAFFDCNSKSITVMKAKGTIDNFLANSRIQEKNSEIGIAHTRWATHGVVNDINAHPHVDCHGTIAVVHNGIIDNYLELREELELKGHVFRSETDTEVIPHLLEHYYRESRNILDALKKALKRLKGTYAVAILTSYDSEKIFFARNGQPLIIGIGDNEFYVASDIPAFLEWTKKALVLRDGDIGFVSRSELHIENYMDPNLKPPELFEVPWNIDQARKGNFPFFMLKEIYEQPDAIQRTIISVSHKASEVAADLLNANFLYIVGAGSSYYSSLYAQYLYAKWGLKSMAVIASEFEDLVGGAIEPNDVILAVSQSGETFDTIQAVKIAKSKGARIISLVNNMGSTLRMISDKSIVMGAGPEIGVAATKTFTTQIASFIVILKKVLELQGIDYERQIQSLQTVPRVLSENMGYFNNRALFIANWIKVKTNAFYLGRGLGQPIALEGALKLKEIAYIHSESYPAGESKHGPIALVEEGFPVVVIVLEDKNHSAVIANIQEMKCRGGKIISLIPAGDTEAQELSDLTIEIPRLDPEVAPMLYVVPLQLLAYHTAVCKGLDPDKPRNLAKSVTVK